MSSELLTLISALWSSELSRVAAFSVLFTVLGYLAYQINVFRRRHDGARLQREDAQVAHRLVIDSVTDRLGDILDRVNHIEHDLSQLSVRGPDAVMQSLAHLYEEVAAVRLLVKELAQSEPQMRKI